MKKITEKNIQKYLACTIAMFRKISFNSKNHSLNCTINTIKEDRLHMP